MAAVTAKSRAVGCLVGAALGDALGLGVRSLTWAEIQKRHGRRGVTEVVEAFGRRGAIGDATQLTLFTAEGLMRGMTRLAYRGKQPSAPHMISHSYRRWAHTQGHHLNTEDGPQPDGWLIGHSFLYNSRQPGRTTIAVSKSGRFGSVESRINLSKGNAAVMRSAPCAIACAPGHHSSGPAGAFGLARDAAALTHGHDCALDAAGAYGTTLAHILAGRSLHDSTQAALAILAHEGKSSDVAHHIERVLEMSRGTTNADPIDDLPVSWNGQTAEEALALGLYCALTAGGFADGVRRAVNHSGSSDATGAICGALLGAAGGAAALPEEWLYTLEGHDVIEQVAIDLERIYRSSRRVTREDDRFYPGT